MKNFDKEFKTLKDDALAFIKDKLTQDNTIVLIEKDVDELPDDFYSLPSEYEHCKYHIDTYSIWKLTLEDGTMYAHGYDAIETAQDFIFTLEDMTWETIIDLASNIS